MDHDEAPSELAHCRCGTNRESKYAIPEREYTAIGTLYLLWGGTAVPTKVTYRCAKCNKVFETITGSREQMRQYTV